MGAGGSRHATRRARCSAATATTRWCWRPPSRRTPAPSPSWTACRSATGRRWSSARSSAVRGTVAMRMELVIRMDYGSVVPWVRRSARGIRAVAGPDALLLTTDVPLHGEGLTTVADFTVAAGEHRSLSLAWHPSHLPPPAPVDADARHRGDRGVVATVGRALHLRGPRSRRGAALPHHDQGDDLRAHRRHRRRADHLAARAAGRRAQLGLPAVLGAGRDLRALRVDPGRLSRRGARLAAVAAPRPRGHARPAPDHVRPRGRAAADRAGAAVAARLRGLRPGARGQRRPRSVSTGRLGRDARRDLRGHAGRARAGRRRPARARTRSCGISNRCGRSRTRASGRCAARAGTSPTPR